jgi:deoxyribonuclease-4
MNQPPQTSAPVYDSEDEYRPEPEPEPQPPHWLDGSVRVGIHTSIAGDIAGALDSACKLGCNALQIFSGSPRMWARPGVGINDVDAARFRARRAELGLGPLAIHANYLINLASAEPIMRTRSIQAFRDEIVRALALGADFLVVHPGSAGGGNATEALSLCSQALRQASRGIRFTSSYVREKQKGTLRILIENTSGMGSAIGVRFEELRAILAGAPDLPVGVCLDTAHLFEAGHDIRTEQSLARVIQEFDDVVGLERLYVLHVNDSKTPFGSRVDRHQNIGSGEIGSASLQLLLQHPRLSARAPQGLPGRAFVLETPIDAPGDDRRNVRALWELAGVALENRPAVDESFSMTRTPVPAAKTAKRAVASKSKSKPSPKKKAKSKG